MPIPTEPIGSIPRPAALLAAMNAHASVTLLRSLAQLRPRQPWNRALNSLSAARLPVPTYASHGEDGVRLQGLDVLRYGGGPRPRGLVSSPKISRTFFVFQPNAKKGDLYPRTVLSSRHGQFGFRRGLRHLQNDA